MSDVVIVIENQDRAALVALISGAADAMDDEAFSAERTGRTRLTRRLHQQADRLHGIVQRLGMTEQAAHGCELCAQTAEQYLDFNHQHESKREQTMSEWNGNDHGDGVLVREVEFECWQVVDTRGDKKRIITVCPCCSRPLKSAWAAKMVATVYCLQK